jgi:hypothetical protein
MEKHPDGVGQYLAPEPMLDVPQTTPVHTRHRTVLGPLSADGVDDEAPAGPWTHQAAWLGRRHTRSERGPPGHHVHEAITY